MILFSPASTSPVYNIKDHVFRLCIEDTQQIHVIIRLLRERGIENVIVFYRGDSWGDGFVNIFESGFKEINGTIISSQRYSAEILDSLGQPLPESFKIIDTKLTEAEKALNETLENKGERKTGVLLMGFDESWYILKSCTNHTRLLDIPWFGLDITVNNTYILKNVPSEAYS